MDETGKDQLRNQVSAIAYFLLALIAGLFVIACTGYAPFNHVLLGVLATFVGICGIILLILHKRDLTALVMLMFAMLFGYYTISGGVLNSDITAVLLFFFIIFALLLLATGSKKGKCYFCVFLPYGIGALGPAFFSSLVVTIIMHCVFGFVALLYGIMFVAPRIKAPLAQILRSEEPISFSRIGAVLGYFLFAIPVAILGVQEILGMTLTDMGTIASLLMLCGFYLVVAGIIIAIFGDRHFAPLLFSLMGVSCLLVPFLGSSLYYVSGGIFIILGICALIQKVNYVLPAILLLVSGALYIVLGTGLSLPVLVIVLSFASALLAVIISFLILHQQRQRIVAQQQAS
ncbi:MAG TPA: hypothetical protein O0X27_05035 [Methanocorpusculum sp.]|nr:hypothetical protein [Methanocorpusculum sp.]